MVTYVRYRIAGGRMKFRESDTDTEHYYTQFPGIELEDIGDWYKDYNNMPSCEWTMSNSEYTEWYLSTHPQPVDIREATRYWMNRRDQLWRRQHPAPRSYEEFLQNKAGNGKNYEDGCFDYVSVPQDTQDGGSLYRMYMIQQQATIDLNHKLEDGA